MITLIQGRGTNIRWGVILGVELYMPQEEALCHLSTYTLYTYLVPCYASSISTWVDTLELYFETSVSLEFLFAESPSQRSKARCRSWILTLEPTSAFMIYPLTLKPNTLICSSTKGKVSSWHSIRCIPMFPETPTPSLYSIMESWSILYVSFLGLYTEIGFQIQYKVLWRKFLDFVKTKQNSDLESQKKHHPNNASLKVESHPEDMKDSKFDTYLQGKVQKRESANDSQAYMTGLHKVRTLNGVEDQPGFLPWERKGYFNVVQKVSVDWIQLAF